MSQPNIFTRGLDAEDDLCLLTGEQPKNQPKPKDITMSTIRNAYPKTIHENQVDMFWIDWEIPESIRALFRDTLGSDYQPHIHVEAVVQGWSTPGSLDEAGDSEFWISESWIDISTGDDLRMDLAPGHPLHEAILDYYGETIIDHAFS